MGSKAIEVLERIRADERIGGSDYLVLRSVINANLYGVWEFTENSLPPLETPVLLADKTGDYLIAEMCIVKQNGGWVLEWQYYDGECEDSVSKPLEDYPYWARLPRNPVKEE